MSDARVALMLATLALAASWPAAAHAQTAPLLELEWNAPMECPDRAKVVARVEALVGPRHPGQHPLSARGRIKSIPGVPSPRYHLELFVGGQPDARARTMNGDDCVRLADVAALILALDIDPEAGTHGNVEAPVDGPDVIEQVDPETPTLRAPEQTPPLPLPRRPRAARPAPPARPRFEGLAGARVLFDSGSLPRPTLGLGAAFELSRGALSLDLQLAAYQSQFTIAGPHHGVGGAYVSLATFGAHGCWGGLAGEVDFRGCLGFELGRDATTGVSIARPESSASLWSAISAMIRARAFPGRPISPVLGIAVLHPVSAPRVEIQGFGSVFEPPAALIRLFLGIEAKFF